MFDFTRLILCFLILVVFAEAQQPPKLIEIADYDATYSYNTEAIVNPNYPPTYLFDGNASTCWVAGQHADDNQSALFLKVPSQQNHLLQFIPGYGKSPALFIANARPKSIRLSLWVGYNPDGWVSETAAIYRSKPFGISREFAINDQMDVVQLSLDSLIRAAKNKKKSFNEGFSNGELLLELTITEAYEGSLYSDIRISELAFAERLIQAKTGKKKTLPDTVWIDDSETMLLGKTADESAGIIFQESESVIQLLELAANNRWVIVMVMPMEITGRVSGYYLLIDLARRADITNTLETLHKDYIWGMPIYFGTDKEKRQYLIFDNPEGGRGTIRLN
jgi:hypothetical protein